MTKLDEALAAAQDGRGEETVFYNEFLNGEVFVALIEEPKEEGEIKPVLVEADGVLHVMLFDEEARLAAWAKREVPFASLPGHEVVRAFGAVHPWMLNVGTEHPKKFVPEEIQWLKDALARADAQPD